MNTVLITAIGGDIAQSIATIIREAYPSYRVLGMDVHERHGGRLFVERFYQAPPASDACYAAWLEDLVFREKVELCIPMSESELLRFAERKEEIGGARILMANAKAIEIGCDKLSTAMFLESIDCPVPWTLPADDWKNIRNFPCIFKPRRSAGSKSVYICSSREEVAFYREKFPAAVLQELLLPEDREVTCAIFRKRDGETAVLQMLRRLVGGFTGWAKVIDDPQVSVQCRRLAEALELEGSINVQLRLTDKGPRIFEINPRFSSTVLMRHRMGFQDLVWSLQDMKGEEVKLQHPQPGMTAVRLQGAALMERSSG